MSLTAQEVGILVTRRLRLPQSERPRIQTLIDEGLNALAYAFINDYEKRKWLMTDKSTATATVVNSNQDYYVDLTTLISNPAIMVDYLEFGKIFHNVAAVTPTAWTTPGYTATAIAHNFSTGTKVQLTTTGTLPTLLSLGTDYYIIRVDADTFALASSRVNAFIGTKVAFTDTGSGNHTITQWEDRLVSQGSENVSDCAYPTGNGTYWQVGTKLYLNNIYGGTLAFSVPFIPTLTTLPAALETDLIDAIVRIAKQAIPIPQPQQ